MQTPMTPLGIETTTLRLVAQFLNQLRHRVHRKRSVLGKNMHLMQQKIFLKT
jgi:hypothetical protein